VPEVALAVTGAAAVWWGIRVRREDARMLDAYVYAGLWSLLAFWIGWVAGYGAFAVVFAPVGAVVGLADAFFKILNLFGEVFLEPFR